MLPVQREYLATHRRGRTADDTAAAKAVDKQSHAELNKLRAKPANAECFDCTALKPGWGVLPHGIFVCIDYAQVHRSIGRHISQTKAINTGTYLWFPHELAVMREVGNGVARRAWSAAPPKPSRDASPDEKTRYATAKYVEGKWGPCWESAAAPPARPPQAAVAAAPAVAPQARAKPAGGLQGARRQASPPTSGPMDDLITFDAPAAPALAAKSAPPAASILAEVQPAPLPPALAVNGAEDEYEGKKRSVLEKFAAGGAVPGRAPQLMPQLGHGHGAHAAARPPPSGGRGDTGDFFAQFGL